MKRVMSIQDISCLGKCSLTVALPIISAMGIETCIVPTAVLSTHTQFNNFTFRDLTCDLDGIKNHWKNENFKFDAIYTGYLGSKEQIDIVIDYFDTFKTDENIIIVDPAMADNGKLYTGFDDDFPLAMARLCKKADIILPNISEAAFMLGAEYPGEDCSHDVIRHLLLELAKLGAKKVVITGVKGPDETFGFMGYATETNEFFDGFTREIKHRSHGTGDVFASAFTGAMMNDFSVKDALMLAAEFTCRCIEDTANDPDGRFYAVNFETQIPYLIEKLGR